MVIDEDNNKEFENSVKEAEYLIKEIEDPENPIPAYQSLERGIAKFEESYDITTLLPADAEPGLGFSLFQFKKSGKEFWEKYSIAIKKDLCDANGKLNTLFKEGLSESARHVISAIMITLALPVAALSIVVPIAAILIKIGLDAYCQWSKR